ncbi:hypothetical protein [Flavimaricola marinus]|uniref:Cytochrome c-552 n=1 Tax=Flavimaricola marinus TaxID=1819565 RepID=A0A238LAE0_9RHOB|nr:hypothetical protein [Flavimaricola marinus]SMY06552.1 Cytochrome c-552 [Flavimaricola marinus]
MRLPVLSAVLACCGASLAMSQSLDLTLTDPDQIAAECGGTAAAGEVLFTSCSACHALQPEDARPTQAGPHLGALFGREVAAVDGYAYSPGLRQLQAEGAIWEREALHAYLQGDLLPDTHPVVAGEQDRRDILTFVRVATLPPPPARGELVVPPEVLAIEGDPAYGEYLASECAGCHRSGSGNVPAIDLLDGEYFITAMHEYRARARTNETMRLIAARLTDEEIAALAAYYLSIE